MALQALLTRQDPRQLADPALAFATCVAYPFCKPSQWPGPEPAKTTARLLWDAEHLFIMYTAEGSFAPPIEPGQCQPAVLAALKADYDPDFADPTLQAVIMLDDRCEVFVQAVLPGVLYQSYFALEINREGRAITNINQSVTSRQFDRAWDASSAYTAQYDESSGTLLVALSWRALNIQPGSTKVNIGLFRAMKPEPMAAQTSDGATIDLPLMSEINESMIWSAWTDPGDDVVDFHRAAFLGELELLEPSAAAVAEEQEVAAAGGAGDGEGGGVVASLIKTVQGWFGGGEERAKL